MAGARETSRQKRFIPVRGDLLSKIIEISNREGKTVFGLTNEVLEQAIRAYELKTTLSDIVETFSLIKMEREMGAIIISSEVLNYLIARLYAQEKENLQEVWRRYGQWIGKYIIAKFHDQDPMEVLSKLLRSCAWDVTDVSVSRDGEGVKVRCLAPYLPSENTELFSKYLEGIMDSLGYCVSKNDTLRGIILLEFRRKGGEYGHNKKG
ncbi:hypothetical protein KEJ19_03665 [Candidatus Bathyarchaeota archaeon]|nr:hypothetical protein [Candidatus Bathyarchaeota archaeon]